MFQVYSLPNFLITFSLSFIRSSLISTCLDHSLSIGSAAAMVRTMPRIFAFHKPPPLLPPSITILIMAVAVLSILSVVALLCGSEARKSRRRLGGKTVRLGDARKQVARLHSSISSKALLLAKTISWRKVQDDGEEDDGSDDEEAVWRKTIIKGEKCRPLDFSGKILYDSDGNLIPDSPQPSK